MQKDFIQFDTIFFKNYANYLPPFTIVNISLWNSIFQIARSKKKKKRERERENRVNYALPILIHPLRTVVNISTPSDVVITPDRGEKIA